jgi:hypothetical protein
MERVSHFGDVRPFPTVDVRSDNRHMKALQPHPWKLMFETREDEDHCDMVVHLDAGNRSLSGHGRSRRNPADQSVPQVGEELAAARALQELARHLTDDAWAMIEEYTQQTPG